MGSYENICCYTITTTCHLAYKIGNKACAINRNL